ncbi:MAG: hypothetical protein AAFY54_16760 [Cyanobacteria bacterium J06648_10]
MRSPSTIATSLIIYIAVTTALLNSPRPALADTRIRGEFEYNLDEQTISEWEIGPVFSLQESMDLEIPIGQSDGEWKAIVELTYEVEISDDFELELSAGVESAENEPIEGFGSIEGSWELQ